MEVRGDTRLVSGSYHELTEPNDVAIGPAGSTYYILKV